MTRGEKWLGQLVQVFKYIIYFIKSLSGVWFENTPPPPADWMVHDPLSNVGLPLGLFCETQWRHRNSFQMATRWKKCYTRPPPPYFIVSATCSSVNVCFIDYDPSVGNMGTQTFRPIVSSHHFLVRRFAPNSYLGKTFRTLPINKEDVSPPSP